MTVSGRMRGLSRLDGTDRLAGIDLARGLAVIGMIAAHLLWFDERFSLTDPATWTDAVNGRSSILFAVLAGASIALTTGGRRPLAGADLAVARGRLAVRAGVLWILGILLALTGVPILVILPAYALLFLLALPLLRLPAARLFVLAAALLLVMPFVQAGLGLLPFWETIAGRGVELAIGWAYPFPLWIAFLVLGMALGRIDLTDARIAGLMVVIGTGLALVAYGIGGMMTAGDVSVAPADYIGIVSSTFPHTGGLPEVIGGAAVAVAVTGGCLLLCRTPMRWIVLPLRATGSMPLTAYSAQIVIIAVSALVATGSTAGLGELRDAGAFWPLTLIVVAGCTVWAMTLGHGPLERVLAWASRRVFPGSATDARALQP